MELRFALRSLWKSPGFTALAVIVLALGIGANTAIFSVVNAVLLRPLHYRDPDRIVTVKTLWNRSRVGSLLTAPDFHDLQNQNSVFAAMGYYVGDQSTVITVWSAEYTRIAMVTPSFFDVMGAAPAEGRLFSETDSKINPAIAVVSAAFWQNHFGQKPVESGQSITAAAKALRIVGIMPKGFGFPGPHRRLDSIVDIPGKSRTQRRILSWHCPAQVRCDIEKSAGAVERDCRAFAAGLSEQQ
jgi:hypothetical protein